MSQRPVPAAIPQVPAQCPPGSDPLLDAVASPVVVLDAAGHIVRFNRACERTTGRDRAEVVGRPFVDLFQLVPTNGHPAGEPDAFETTCTGPHGRQCRIEWVKTALAPPAADGAEAVVCTGRDVTDARAAEQSAREKERLYRRIVETAREGIWVIDPDGRTLYANPRIAEILGYSPEEMAGVNVLDCMPPEDHAGFKQRMERRKRGETQTLEWPCLRKDRSVRWTMITSSPLHDDDGRLIGILGMITDISEQKRVAEALRESEERFRLAVETSPDSMFFQDTDLRITWVSRTVPPRTPADLIGKTDAELLPPAEAARLAVIKRRVMETGTPERADLEFISGDVRMNVDLMLVRRTAADGTVLGLAGYARDVTEQVAAQRALAELNHTLEQRVIDRAESLRFSEERFRLMVEQAPVSIQILSPDGRTLQVNDAFRRLFGVGAEELANYNILHDPQLEATGIMPQIRRAFAGGTAVVPPIPYVPDRGPLTGQERWAQALMYSVKGADGQVREVVLVHEDVTDRYRAEQQLRQSEQHHRELAERNRLLVQEVEHRVGNNLAGLLGLVGIMRSRVRDVDTFAASIEVRLRAMTRVHRMLVGSGWGAVGLRDLVGTVLGGMGQMAPCAAAEHVTGPDVPVPPKLALPLALILAEWHTNSCKYGAHSAPGGRLDVVWTVEWSVGEAVTTSSSDGKAGPRVRLTWRERGGPPVRQGAQASVGTELVRAFAATELRGQCTMSYLPDGADHVIEFRVAE